MPKWDWDKFAAGFADKGLEAFKAGGQLGIANREATRREAATAFDMGSKLPVVFGGGVGGGLGGMARGQIADQAGVMPPEDEETDYESYDTAGGIGAAPGVEEAGGGPMGDAPSRQMASESGATAQTGKLDDNIVAKYLGGMNPERRKDLDAGVEAHAAKIREDDVVDGIKQLDGVLREARILKVGDEAARKVIERNAVQIDHFTQALDALYQSRRNAPAEAQAEIADNIQRIGARIEMLHQEAQGARKAVAEKRQAAEILSSEANRRGKYLELIGVPPDLIENYGKVFMENGDINNAGRLIKIHAGRGVSAKRASGGPRSRSGTARPLR